MKAHVCFNSWAGKTWHRVTVLKEGEKRSKVRFEEPAYWRPAGHVQWVPNGAMWFGEPSRDGDSHES